jgi:large subunit ribosomal protein L13
MPLKWFKFNSYKMKTLHPKLADVQQTRKWFVIDAKGQVLGKVATRAAVVLRGKNKADWHPSIDCGDHLVIINADKVVLTGQKEFNKEYIHHTGYPGALKRVTVEKMRATYPERILEKAIAGMIPRNRLKKLILNKLHVYAGTDHPHAPQTPEPLTV